MQLRNVLLRKLPVGHVGVPEVPEAAWPCTKNESDERRLLLEGYFSSLGVQMGRYLAKLSVINGFDPYESERKDWNDDVDLWPGITYVHLGMYLLATPSPYTGEDLLNYKSLDCYVNFISGWVRKC